MRVPPATAFYWHAALLAITTSVTEVNTVMPALVLAAGGTAMTVGLLTAVMVGLPLVAQLLFAGFLHTRELKRPYLLLGIGLRVLALASGAVAIAAVGADPLVIPVVFATMTVFALSGAFAGVSYTDLVGTLIAPADRRRFFGRRQIWTTLGLALSALLTKVLLDAATFPDGYVLLFAMGAAFLALGGAAFVWMPEPRVTTTATGSRSLFAAIRLAPGILRADANLRRMVAAANLVAVAITALPLLVAFAGQRYQLTTTTVGTLVVVQIAGMLLATPLWTRLIKNGGYRRVLLVEVAAIVVLFPSALALGNSAPLEVFAALYVVSGALLAAHRIAMDGALVHISPDGERALYAGVFGAANLASALLPVASAGLVGLVGFGGVFWAAAAAGALALVPILRLDCGRWYTEES